MNKKVGFGLLLIIFSISLTPAFAQSDVDTDLPEEQGTVADPLEGFNRIIFSINDTLDTYVLKPVASFYNYVLPNPVRQGVNNFFNNLDELPTIANDVLQLNFYQAANDIWRFGINTTVGVVGIFDVGSRMSLMPFQNDFGLTLARWGYKKSNYLVLPLFGPYTVRDGLIGFPVDYMAFSIWPYIKPDKTRYALYALGAIDRRAHLLKFEPVMEEAAIDKYAFVRSAYMQKRQHQVEGVDQLGVRDRHNMDEPVASASAEASSEPVA